MSPSVLNPAETLAREHAPPLDSRFGIGTRSACRRAGPCLARKAVTNRALPVTHRLLQPDTIGHDDVGNRLAKVATTLSAGPALPVDAYWVATASWPVLPESSSSVSMLGQGAIGSKPGRLQDLSNHGSVGP